MKFCEYGQNQLYVGYNGDCYLCYWMNVSVGNLAEQSFEEIYYGEKAETVRRAWANGDYCYCNSSCKQIENEDFLDLPPDEVKKRIYENEKGLKGIALAYDKICNHSCPSCRNKVFVPDEKEKLCLDLLDEKVLNICMQNEDTLKLIAFSGAGDIFASPNAMRLAEQIRPKNKDCEIQIQSNGALFNEKNWKKIEHFKDYNLIVTITPNSFNRVNYMYINGGHDTYDATIENLKFIKSLREKNYVNEFNISIVVQERNFMDLPEFIDRSINEFNCDSVIIKPLYKWFLITEENFWYKDILNPLHPYHKQYMEILNSPIMDNPKVYLWGAKNLHKPSLHPAYKYKGYLKAVTDMFTIPNWDEKFKQLMKDKNADDVIIYGENEITDVIYEHLKKIGISARFNLARDFNCCECQSNLKKVSIKDYKSNENDFVLITNYDVRNLIERDLYFNEFKGYLCDIDELNQKFKEG